MTNEYNLKEGDKVMLANDTNTIGVVRFVGKDSCIVDFGLGDSTTDYKDIVLLDRRTAFLTELQALLRKYDARIYDNDYYRVYIDLGIHSVGNESIVYSDTNGEVTADNIMDFDKD